MPVSKHRIQQCHLYNGERVERRTEGRKDGGMERWRERGEGGEKREREEIK